MVDRVGQKLGNYRITGSLGRGGFAEVYLAEHIYLKTLVAIKLLYTRLSFEEEMASFVKEAQTIAQLAHPHIIRVLDFGVDNEMPYLVMDYAANGNLRQRFPKGTRIPLPTVVSYTQQIADALQYAHDKGFIHQDIKPENILLNQNNTALLSDFGLAKVRQHTSSQKTDSVAGTAQYMSPEQFKGRPRPASDQYSLAIIVYEWLCGEPPFTEGDFIQLGFQHTYEPVPALTTKAATIAPDVNHVVMTALSKDAKQRFGSVKAFANALEQAAGTIGQFSVPPRIMPALPVQGKGQQPTQFEPVQPVQSKPLPQSEPVRMANSAALSNARPIMDSFPGKPIIVPRPPKQTNMWAFGRKQLLASLIGLVLNIVAYQIRLLIPHTYFTLPPLIFQSFCLIFLSFGVLFGPWVGLIVASFGYIVARTLFFPSSSFYWLVCFMLGVAGFIAGVAALSTKGRYRTFRSAFVACIFAEIGLVLEIAIVLNYFHDSGTFITSYIVANSIAPLLLLILLPVYDRIIYGNKAL